MSETKPKGRYRAKYVRKAKTGIFRLLLPVLLAVMLVLSILIVLRLWSDRKAETQFQELSAMVQTQTQPTVPSQPPVTDATSPSVPETLPDETVPPETVPVILEKYQPLYAQNPDLFGWIRIEGSSIDYPVMYTPGDPEKYLHLDFQENYSYPGVPFLDASCSPSSDNLLIYGHNMSNGTMFHGLLRYEQKNYWAEHPTITFDTLYAEQEFEVLAAFYDRVYYQNEDVFKFYQFIDARDAQAFDQAVATLKSKSIYDTGVTASYGDQLVTLVTCAYHVDNGRFVLVARRK